jgi:hypothetical protein
MKYTVFYGKNSVSFLHGLPYSQSFNRKKEAIKFARDCAKEYRDINGYSGSEAAVVVDKDMKVIFVNNLVYDE